MRLWSDTRGQGPDLVLLHGWGMNAAVWSPLLGHLQRYRVTRIELPGHGESEFAPESDTLGAWGEAVLATVPAVGRAVPDGPGNGPGRRAQPALHGGASPPAPSLPREGGGGEDPATTSMPILLGWSLGASVAQWIALNHPQRIGGLISLCGTPRFTRAAGWPEAMEPEILEQFAGELVANQRQTLDRFLALQVRGDGQARQTLRQLRTEVGSRPEARPEALKVGLELLRSVDLRGELKNLTVPSLWLFGERDMLVPAGVAECLPGLLGGAPTEIQVLPKAAHAPFIADPAGVATEIGRFIRGLDG